MSDEQVDESMVRADRLSKVIALFVAIGLFLLGGQLIEDPQFNMITAAFIGIGVRLYVPYHASITVARRDEPIQEYAGTGNYHHGAVGAGLVVLSLVAVLAMTIDPAFWQALGVGAAAGLVSVLVLRGILPG
jgi:hypothetical protein